MFKIKKVIAITVTAAKFTVRKLLTIPTNAVLKRKKRYRQDMSMIKI